LSHFKCPICGLNRHLNSWNPETYDNDIIANTPVGLGRGQGFEITDENSILGDADITPRITQRMTSLLNTFVEEKIISPNDLVKHLKLHEHIQGQGYVTIQEHNGLQDLCRSLVKEREKLRAEKNSAEGDVRELKRKLDEIDKKQKLKDEADRILGWFYETCDATMEFDKEFGFVLRISLIDITLVDDLKKMKSSVSDEVKKMVKERIIGDYKINFILDALFFSKPPITVSERLLMA
jgi:hypothetical protein